MPMNEYGEIVRNSASEEAPTHESSRRTWDIEEDLEERSFLNHIVATDRESKRRNAFLISLAIGVPLFALAGYIASGYIPFSFITGKIGAIFGAVDALVCILVCNSQIYYYKGHEYVVSLLVAGLILGGAILLCIMLSKLIAFAVQKPFSFIGIIIVMCVISAFFENIT